MNLSGPKPNIGRNRAFTDGSSAGTFHFFVSSKVEFQMLDRPPSPPDNSFEPASESVI